MPIPTNSAEQAVVLQVERAFAVFAICAEGRVMMSPAMDLVSALGKAKNIALDLAPLMPTPAELAIVEVLPVRLEILSLPDSEKRQLKLAAARVIEGGESNLRAEQQAAIERGRTRSLGGRLWRALAGGCAGTWASWRFAAHYLCGACVCEE